MLSSATLSSAKQSRRLGIWPGVKGAKGRERPNAVSPTWMSYLSTLYSSLYRQALEAARQSESNEAALRDAEAAASRTIATKSALKANPSVKSWWSGLSLWSKETNTTAGQPRDALHIEDSGTKKGDR